MTEITVSEDCGNAPKKVLLRDYSASAERHYCNRSSPHRYSINSSRNQLLDLRRLQNDVKAQSVLVYAPKNFAFASAVYGGGG